MLELTINQSQPLASKSRIEYKWANLTTTTAQTSLRIRAV